MKVIIATIRSWYIKNTIEFMKNNPNISVLPIFEKEELNFCNVKNFNPDYIFFPHWSSYIPAEIYENYKCVVFHPSDLPFGRGGSPVQNLISLGLKETKISAINVCKELDAGDVYIKEKISLLGSAEEIFINISNIIFHKMIPQIIEKEIILTPQIGEIVTFNRRKPEQSVMPMNANLNALYDHIRMLDAEEYPKAYIEYGNFKIIISNAVRRVDSIEGIVEIKLKEDEKN